MSGLPWEQGMSERGVFAVARYYGLLIRVEAWEGDESDWSIRDVARKRTLSWGHVKGKGHFEKAQTQAQRSVMSVMRQRLEVLKLMKDIPILTRDVVEILERIALRRQILITNVLGDSRAHREARNEAFAAIYSELRWSHKRIGTLFRCGEETVRLGIKTWRNT